MDFLLLFSFLLEAGNIVIFESTEHQRRYFLLSDIRNSTALWRLPCFLHFVLPVSVALRWRWVWNFSVMIVTGENRSDRRKSSPIAPSSSTLLTWSGQGSNWPSAAKGWWQTTWTKGQKCSPVSESALVFRIVSVLSPCKCTMQECGALVDWQWGGKSKYSEKNSSQRLFVLHKSRMIWPGIEPALCDEKPATNHRNQGTKIFKIICKKLVLTAWWTYVSITKARRFMLFNEVFLFIARISARHTDALWSHNVVIGC